MRGGSSSDPFVLTENLRSDQINNDAGVQDVNGRTLRNQTVNTGIRNLILLNYGCSNGAGVAPGVYTPVNGSVLDNFNIYDGAMYAAQNPLLSCNTSPLGSGNVLTVLGDTLVGNGRFDRVILVPCCIGGTATFHWASGGVHYNRINVAMLRLKERGITPTTPGCTFAIVHYCGENEHGITQAQYIANVQQNTAKIKDVGFSGRIFVNLQTMLGNVFDATIRSAQAALVDNVTYFSGGDIDSLTGSTYRQADNTHLTTAGQAAAATLVYNAMHASGAPF